jgi:hypothetical protein
MTALLSSDVVPAIRVNSLEVDTDVARVRVGC